MMDRSYDFDGIIRSIILDETKYLRHYLAKVEDNTDPLFGGRVLVTIPKLGWDTQEKGQWARPRQVRGLSVPKVGEWVEVYFIDGSVNTLAYMGIALEMQNMIPKNYTGTSLHVLWEMPGDKEQVIKYDADEKKATLKFEKLDIDIVDTLAVTADTKATLDCNDIVVNGGAEKAVLGTALDTWMTGTLKVWADTHTHAFTAPAGPVGVTATPLTAPTNYLSNEIKIK
jgi:hypothetical protein